MKEIIVSVPLNELKLKMNKEIALSVVREKRGKIHLIGRVLSNKDNRIVGIKCLCTAGDNYITFDINISKDIKEIDKMLIKIIGISKRRTDGKLVLDNMPKNYIYELPKYVDANSCGLNYLPKYASYTTLINFDDAIKHVFIGAIFETIIMALPGKLKSDNSIGIIEMSKKEFINEYFSDIPYSIAGYNLDLKNKVIIKKK